MARANKKISVMLIEDEVFDVQRIKKTIKPFEDRIMISDIVSNGRAAVDLLKKHPYKYDVIIMDFQISGGLMGEKLIRKIKQIDSTLQVIVVTKMTINMTDYAFANSLLEAGANWYCTKYPGDLEDFIYQPTDFILNIFNAYERKKLEEAKISSHIKLEKNIKDILAKKQIVGKSPAIMKLRQQIEQCANTNINVLITGASGTGKELVAANIHYNSKRKFENFVPINCGSLPDNLIESELFGFEKGSFTGADKGKLGLFEIANRGTLFLDEITELSLSAQSTLLRVIQEGEIDKIGRTQKMKVDVRIIAATNKNLKQEVENKRFREDLYYRLNVVSINVPPLSQRRDDIPLLIRHFMDIFSRDMNRLQPEVSPEAMSILRNSPWEGNVRELQNIVQRLLLLGEESIQAQHVKIALGIITDVGGLTTESLNLLKNDKVLPWKEIERKLKREYFQNVRQRTSSDAEAARLLGLAPPNYYRVCKELGLK